MEHRRKRKELLYTFLLMFCAMLFCLLPGLRTKAAEKKETAPVLRVVLTNYDDAGFVKVEDGVVSGYYVDYLNEIAKYTGWQYEYQVISEEAELLQVTQEGNFDLMLGIYYTSADDEQYFDYPSVSIGNKNLVLAASKKYSELDGEDTSSLQGIRVGIIDTYHNKQLEQKFEGFCISNGLEFTVDSEKVSKRAVNLVTVEQDARFELLKSGALDAVITTDSKALENELYVITDYANTPIYAVVPNGDGRYFSLLEKTLSIIKSLDKDYDERLYEEYFQANEESELAFTKAEQSFMINKHHYKVALWNGCAPYAYLDEDGKWCGIAVKVFEEITRMTDNKLTFEFVSYPSSFAANEALAKGEVDILGQTFTSVDIAERGVNRSTSYYSDSFSMYVNRAVSVENLEDSTIVVKKDVTDEMLLELGVTDVSGILRVNTVVDALQYVNEGNADVTFALQNVGDYYINYYELAELTELPLRTEVSSLCCVYSDTMESHAKLICNKCIGYIDVELLERTIREYILTDHKPVSLEDYIEANLSTTAVLIISVLLVAVTCLCVVILIVQNKSRKIYRMLYHDDITEGISYRKFEEEVAEIIGDQKEKYDIIFVDINSFKYINDVFGYEVGNKVLCTVEKFIETLTNGFPYARMYSDHFVAIRPHAAKRDLMKLLDDRLSQFAEQCSEEYPDFNIFLKMGIYTWNGENLSDIRQYVNLANYAADGITNMSSSNYCFYTMEMHDKVLSRQEIEKDMHRAMNEGEFIAFYQPKYDIITNEIIGAEALVRWMHKEKGMISPGKFIPIFEENGFVGEVDFCILRQVCALLAERIEKGEKLYPISCNFYRGHFKQSDFVERLVEVVEEYKVPPQYIEIEITETVAADDFKMLVRTAIELKEKGFRISIDDFGSGYSSIQLLYKLPIDVLKLDRVFVVEQECNKKEEDINRSIIHICHNHDIKIVCEGVETLEQRDYVQSYGCRFVQGFLYSKPVPKETFLEMLSAYYYDVGTFRTTNSI